VRKQWVSENARWKSKGYKWLRVRTTYVLKKGCWGFNNSFKQSISKPTPVLRMIDDLLTHQPVQLVQCLSYPCQAIHLELQSCTSKDNTKSTTTSKNLLGNHKDDQYFTNFVTMDKPMWFSFPKNVTQLISVMTCRSCFFTNILKPPLNPSTMIYDPYISYISKVCRKYSE
jgi:hypothetical protein